MADQGALFNLGVNIRYYDNFCGLWKCDLLLCSDLDDAVTLIYLCRLL